MTKTNEITELAIKRHDIDASHFQDTYLNTNPEKLSTHQAAFLKGRALVLDELKNVLATLPKGARILDVGCGTAHLTNWIKNMGFEVYGIEPSAEMLAFAKKNFPDIEIKQGISSKIDYPDNHFDLIVAFEVFRYLHKDENIKSFHEFKRVLKSDGSFFITQVNRYCSDFYYFFHNLKAVYSKIVNRVHHYCNFTTAGEQEQQIKSAGFNNVFTVGRYCGTVRIAYKLGKGFGNAYYNFMEKIYGKQRFLNSFSKNTSAHLIVVAKK
jgi:ubiquinone/menaquinone biosynthesis C-methylase UbiE